MEFTYNFGGRKLLYNGYFLMRDNYLADVTYWRCEKRGICSSRMITSTVSGSVEKVPSSYNHQLGIAFVEAAIIKGAIKLRFTKTD